MDYANKYASVADIYDRYVTVDADIPFWLQECAHEEVLELAAGTGRITLPLAKAGSKVTALDISTELLTQLRAKARQEGLDIETVQADMRSFDLGREYRLVILPFQSIQELIEPADHQAVFAAVRKHLVPDGRFLVTIHNRQKMLSTAGEERFLGEFPYGKSSIKFFVTTTIDGNVARNAQRYDEYKGSALIGSRIFVNESYVFSKSAFEELIRTAGFAIRQLFGDYAKGPAIENSPFYIYELRLA